MSLSDALKVAEEAGVDLVEISPSAEPPVVKVVDWGKYQYQKMERTTQEPETRQGSRIKTNAHRLENRFERPRNKA